MYQGEVLMTGSGKAVVAPAALANEAASVNDHEEVVTRFGAVTVSRANPIVFPNGLLGMPDKMQYALTAFPLEKFARFKLLQSLDDKSLSFITMPMDVSNGIIAQEDIAQAANDLGIPSEHLAILLIVSVHREMNGVRLSVNARAPLLMHALKRSAYQYVFASSKYNIRHVIGF